MRLSFTPLLLCLASLAQSAAADFDRPLVFPRPQEMKVSEGRLPLSETSVIALPVNASGNDLLLAQFLVEELIDRWSIHVAVQRFSTLPPNKSVILLGSMANPLVKAYCDRNGITPVRNHASAYVLRVTENVALVAGTDDDGSFYGLQSLRQLIEQSADRIAVRNVHVRDWPDKPFRGIRIYWTGIRN